MIRLYGLSPFDYKLSFVCKTKCCLHTCYALLTLTDCALPGALSVYEPNLLVCCSLLMKASLYCCISD
jgi:hypothetical protein